MKNNIYIEPVKKLRVSHTVHPDKRESFNPYAPKEYVDTRTNEDLLKSAKRIKEK